MHDNQTRIWARAPMDSTLSSELRPGISCRNIAIAIRFGISLCQIPGCGRLIFRGAVNVQLDVLQKGPHKVCRWLKTNCSLGDRYPNREILNALVTICIM